MTQGQLCQKQSGKIVGLACIMATTWPAEDEKTYLGRTTVIRPTRWLQLLLPAVALAGVAILFGITKGSGTTADSRLDFTLTYKLNIDNIPQGAKSVQVWLPLPTDSKYQQLVSYHVSSELPYEIEVEAKYGNRLLHFSSPDDIPQDLEITVDINCIRYEQDGWTQEPVVTSNAVGDLQRYLQPNLLVPIDGHIETEARQVVNDAMTSVEKMEALYDHLFETMKYDKSGIGWGQGDALYACDTRKGNCTDIHSLFIGMARSLNIPSRFIIGFPLPDGEQTMPISGYHCWAECYLPDRGWVPVDISEAIKHPDKADYYFGRLDQHRVAFTIGRDILLASGDSTHRLNYFIYPHVVLDGQPFDGVSYDFSYTRNN